MGSFRERAAAARAKNERLQQLTNVISQMTAGQLLLRVDMVRQAVALLVEVQGDLIELMEDVNRETKKR